MIIAAFISLCMMTKTELLEEHAVQIQTYQTMESREIEPQEEQSEIYFGNCRITFYCGGPCCCGQWAGGGTASGTTATANRTVANGSLPFGTKVLIDGQTYTVEDRGVGGDQFDIYVDSHQEALNRGLYYTDVYILEG